jgi:hypothetical protein
VPVAANALADVPTKPAATSDADPIFAAIEAHKQANLDSAAVLARHNAELEKLGTGHFDEDATTWAEWEATGNREGETYWTFWHTMPTTVAGMAAYFQYLQSPRWPGQNDAADDTIIQDARNNGGWWDSHGRGDGGSPSLMDWSRLMELALRRIAAT